MPLTMDELTAYSTQDSPGVQARRRGRAWARQAASEDTILSLASSRIPPRPQPLVPSRMGAGPVPNPKEAPVLATVKAHSDAARTLAAKGQHRAAREALGSAKDTIARHRNRMTPEAGAAAVVEVSQAHKDVVATVQAQGGLDPRDMPAAALLSGMRGLGGLTGLRGFGGSFGDGEDQAAAIAAYMNPATATYATRTPAPDSAYYTGPGAAAKDWSAPNQLMYPVMPGQQAWTSPWNGYAYYGGNMIPGGGAVNMFVPPMGAGGAQRAAILPNGAWPGAGAAIEKF